MRTGTLMLINIGSTREVFMMMKFIHNSLCLFRKGGAIGPVS